MIRITKQVDDIVILHVSGKPNVNVSPHARHTARFSCECGECMVILNIIWLFFGGSRLPASAHLLSRHDSQHIFDLFISG